MLFIYLLSSLLLLASGALSIPSLRIYSVPNTIRLSHPVVFTCEVGAYHQGTANYTVAFYRGHSLSNPNLIGKHEIFTTSNNHHTVIFSAGKFSDAEARSGNFYSLPNFELRFEPKANVTPYENYWCELIEQSHQPVLTHSSNVIILQPSVNFELTARKISPITATCTIDNFNPASVHEYSVVFYNADTTHVYRLGTYYVKEGAEKEFIPNSTLPEVIVRGNRFTFPVFEVIIDRRFTNKLYYCALERSFPGSSGLSYISNTILG